MAAPIAAPLAAKPVKLIPAMFVEGLTNWPELLNCNVPVEAALPIAPGTPCALCLHDLYSG